MSKLLSAIVCLAILCGAPARATADNLLMNGDFEDGLVGWTGNGYVGPDATPGADPLNHVYTEPAHDALGYFGQAIATVPNGIYTLEFDLQVQSAPGNVADTEVLVSFNFNPVYASINTTHGWQHFTFTGLVGGDSDYTWLLFVNRNSFAYNQLDNVSMVQTGIAPVPEPSSVAMLILGLCLLGVTLRHRDRRFS